MSTKEKIVYSAVIIIIVAVMVAILIFLVDKLHERDAEPESVVAQEESHPHPHPLRFRSPDELRAWRVYVANGIRGRSFWNVPDVISTADRLIRAERKRKPILKPKPKPRKEDAL